jgi:putative mRNA 3-end processing factor
VVSGDYKLEPDPTCAAFEPVACDTFVTESTFGLPIYRWPPEAEVFAEIGNWWAANQQAGKASVLFAYGLDATKEEPRRRHDPRQPTSRRWESASRRAL